MKIKSCPLLLAAALLAGLVAGKANAQSTGSPYSFLGIGEVDSGNFGENSGMGGIGIGFRQFNTLNSANPASLVAISPQTMVFDGSFYGKISRYAGQGMTENRGYGNVQRVALGFRVARPWFLSAGVLPFSSVGYNIRTTSPIEGTGATYETTFSGSGGLNKLFIAQAFSITPNLSVGVNSSLIFGTITHLEETDYWVAQNRARGEKIYFDFGLQYTGLLSAATQMTAGLVGGYGARMEMHNKKLIYNYDGSTVKEENLLPTEESIPEFYGAGISFNHRNRWLAGLDYRLERWSGTNSTSATVRYKDMNKVALGFSMIPNTYNPKKYWQMIKYQAGFMINDSYLRVDGKATVNYAVTGGMVFPMRNTNSLSLGLEYGKNGGLTGSRNAIRENYFKVTLGFSFKDSWFLRIRYD